MFQCHYIVLHSVYTYVIHREIRRVHVKNYYYTVRKKRLLYNIVNLNEVN